jgi:catechol 2,3-dioxygenase-like lactoylglutathione lyase family enzyme
MIEDMEQRLSLVTLGVADLEAARRFYEGLGWTPVSGPDDVHFFQAGCMVVALWIARRAARGQRRRRPGGWGGITLAHNVRSPPRSTR